MTAGSEREIAYRTLGSGPPLVVINGLAATSEDWDPTFIERLSASSELLLLDNRGMGGSPDDGSPFTIADLAADCARVIARLGAPAAVLGWSMGGFIAQALALEHPQHVAKLVLLSTDPGGPSAERCDSEILAQLTDLSPPPHEQARRLLSVLFDDELALRLYAQVGDIVADARARLNQDLLDRQVSALHAWHRDGVAERLGRIAVPTLVATGTSDRVIPAGNSLSLAKGIADAWLLRFRGGGHAFMAQHPATVASIINEFVAL
jgi:pimeloyl-ACP methyl ester carboxylesterase